MDEILFVPSLNALSILKSINARNSIDLSHSERVKYILILNYLLHD